MMVNNNMDGSYYQSENDNYHVRLSKMFSAYRGSIHVAASMCIGTVVSILYFYISNLSIVRHYDRMIHDRILQHPVVQRYTNTNHTSGTTRPRNNNNNHQNTNLPPRGGLPPGLAPQLRQRYNASATTSTTAGTTIDTSGNNNENPWRIPTGGEAVAGLGMEDTGMATTTIPLLPPDQVDMDAIEQLCTMGFERAPVVLALRQSHNNIEHAANRLLSSTG